MIYISVSTEKIQRGQRELNLHERIFNSGSTLRESYSHMTTRKMMTEIHDIQLWILYLSEFTPWTRLVYKGPRKEALYPTLIQRPVCLSGLGRGKGSASTLQFFSFPFVKPVSEPTYMDTFGRSSGRKEKQNRTWLFTFVFVSHSILTATHTIFTYTVKIIQLLVFQSISLSSFRDTGVGMNVPHALTLSCHNPRGKSVKTGLFAIAA